MSKELHCKMLKLSLHQEKKEETKYDSINVNTAPEGASTVQAAAPTSATISSIIVKGVNEAFKQIEVLISCRAYKGAKVKSMSSSHKRKYSLANISSFPRKKAQQEAYWEGSPRWTKRESKRGKQAAESYTIGGSKGVSAQEHNLISAGVQTEPPIWLKNLRENKILGVVKPTIFISPKASLPAQVEKFWLLNGKFVLATQNPMMIKTCSCNRPR